MLLLKTPHTEITCASRSYRQAPVKVRIGIKITPWRLINSIFLLGVGIWKLRVSGSMCWILALCGGWTSDVDALMCGFRFSSFISFQLVLVLSSWTEAPEIIPLLFISDTGHVVFALSNGILGAVGGSLHFFAMLKCKSMSTESNTSSDHFWLVRPFHDHDNGAWAAVFVIIGSPLILVTLMVRTFLFWAMCLFLYTWRWLLLPIGILITDRGERRSCLFYLDELIEFDFLKEAI